ncbi:MAG: mechanosensitive ion channel [Planctomycetes bacterium]|nr:mechanosensitive ion channel [Planctomycetota bacterium]
MTRLLSSILVLVLAFASLLSAQGGTGSVPGTAPALEEKKVPENAADAQKMQKVVQALLDQIPAETTDKKELRAAYDVQVQQLGQLYREYGALETFDARRDELLKQKEALEAEIKRLPEPVVPTISYRSVDKEKDTEARTLLDKYQRELTEISNRLTQKRTDRQELANSIEKLSKTIGEKAAEIEAADQRLREESQKGGDVLLREEQAFAARLARAVLVQRKAVLEKEQITGRRQLEEDIIVLEETIARRKVSDQTAIRDAIAKAFTEKQERDGRTALENAKRDRDRYPQGHPWRNWYAFQVEALETDQKLTALRSSSINLESSLADVGALEPLTEEAKGLQDEIKTSRGDDGEADALVSAAQIRQRLDDALGRAEGSRRANALLKAAADELIQTSKGADKAEARLSSRILLARDEARRWEGGDANGRPTEQNWIDIENQLRTALGNLQGAVEKQQSNLNSLRDGWNGLRRIADENIAKLRNRLRWTREEGHITTDSLENAASDAVDVVENAPSLLGRAVEVVKGYLLAKDRRTRLIVVAVLFVALGFLLWRVRQRLPTTYVWIEEQSQGGSQFFKVLGIFLRRTDLSLLVALLFVGAPLAAGMEKTIVLVSACLFGTPFLYRLGRTILDVFFQPGSNDVRFFDMDEELAQIVHRAGRWMLNLALFFLPIGYLMELSGYEAKNPGFVELWWLVHGSLTQLVLLFSIFRPKVVRTLIRGQNIVAVSLKAWILLAYPLIVGGTLFIFLLGSLRYETAQDFFQVIIAKSLALLIGGYVLYRIVLRAFLHGQEINQGLNQDEFESDDAYVAAGRKQFSAKLVRTLLRFAFAIPLMIVIARVWEEVSFAWASRSLVGEGSISLVDIGEAILVVFVTAIVVGKVRGALNFVILPGTRLDRGLRYTVVMLTTYGLWTVGMVIALQILKVQGEHIAVFTGALAFGIGFGLQSIVKNFFSGLILLIERPVKIGDMVEVENRSGAVEKITLRATTVMTWEGIGVVIPNELMIGGSLTNYSLGHPRLRSTLAVGVAYGSEIQKVRKILYEVVNNHGLVLKRPEPEVFFVGFGDSSLDFQVNIWTNITTHRPRTMSDLRFALDAAFRREGIEIPFPQRDLNIRSVAGNLVAAFGGAKLPEKGDGGALDQGPGTQDSGSPKSSS